MDDLGQNLQLDLNCRYDRILKTCQLWLSLDFNFNQSSIMFAFPEPSKTKGGDDVARTMEKLIEI